MACSALELRQDTAPIVSFVVVAVFYAAVCVAEGVDTV